MSEQKKPEVMPEVMNELKDVLAGVPEKYHKDVCQLLTHDICVIARTIRIMEAV